MEERWEMLTGKNSWKLDGLSLVSGNLQNMHDVAHLGG